MATADVLVQRFEYYFRHPDWVVRSRPPAALWQPAIATPDGLKATADWYREQGWL